MRVVMTSFLLAASILVLPACQKKAEPQADQNFAIDSGNIPANADIEALPPDESSGTSSNELEAGTDNPDVNDLNASTNSY
jgi:hypothetical protein